MACMTTSLLVYLQFVSWGGMQRSNGQSARAAARGSVGRPTGAAARGLKVERHLRKPGRSGKYAQLAVEDGVHAG